jgi:hypothetical protein
VEDRSVKGRQVSPDDPHMSVGGGGGGKLAQGLILAMFAGVQSLSLRLPAPVTRGGGDGNAAATGQQAGACSDSQPAMDAAVEWAAVRLQPVISRLESEGPPPDWREFGRLAAEADAGVPKGAVMVAWAPYLRAGGRADYEEGSGRQAYRSFRLHDGPDATGATVPAPPRVVHFPVELIHPVHSPGASRLLGYDLLAQPALARAAAHARVTGEPEPAWVQGLAGGAAPAAAAPHLAVVFPIHRGGGPSAAHPDGLLVVAFTGDLAPVACQPPAAAPPGPTVTSGRRQPRW